MWKLGRRLLTTTAIAGCGASAMYVYHDEGLSRSAYFWWNMFPIYIHYRYTQYKVQGLSEQEQDRAYNALHETYADKAGDILEKLQNFYIKIAQVGSTRADFLPEPYLRRCSKLQDQVPHRPYSDVKKIVELSMGSKIEDVFSSFDPIPVGAASIGQVHKAVLKKTGKVVAVKVMYPNAEKGFRTDIDTIKLFCRIAQPVHLAALKEIEKQFLTEFDYRKEAVNLDQVATNLEKSKAPWVKQVVVPRPYLDYCTRNVLVMDYLEGVKLVKGIQNQYTRLAASKGMTLEEFSRKQKELHKPGETGPSAQQIRMFSYYLRASDSIHNLGKTLYNYSLGWVWGRYEYRHTILPINIPEVLDTLQQVHAHEIFFDGCFNGDPHPGNILLLNDGRLGLIDYGQVKKMSVKQRIQLAKLIIAISRKHDDEVVRLYNEMGYRTEKNLPEVVREAAYLIYDRDDPEACGGKNIQTRLEELNAIDAIAQLPDDFIMSGRVAILLRGLGFALNYFEPTSKSWAPVAKRFLDQQGVGY